MNRRAKWLWTAAAAYMAAIFLLSSTQLPAPPPVVAGIDKGEHFIAYAGLAAIVFAALRATYARWSLLALAVTAAAIAGAYGATDEIHQNFVPTRQCDVSDWIADILGAVVGSVIMVVVLRMRRQDHG